MTHKFKCVDTFTVTVFDSFAGCVTGDNYQIDEGSIWQCEEPVQENATEVELTTKDKDSPWICINKALFDLMFEPVSD